MPALTVWLLTFVNLNNHASTSAGVFMTEEACIQTAAYEYGAANPKGDSGLHFFCEGFVVASRPGLDCEPFVSQKCLSKAAARPASSPTVEPK